MDDLVRWLTACLDEDERIARAMSEPPDWHQGPGDDPEWTDEEMVCMWPPEFHTPFERDKHWRGLTVPGESLAAFIAEHDPARVLREIEAKRKLLALLPDIQHADQLIEGEYGSSDGLAGKALATLLAPYPKCGAAAVFWPEDEACDAVCVWPRIHDGTRHMDEALGIWDEDELPTSRPPE